MSTAYEDNKYFPDTGIYPLEYSVLEVERIPLEEVGDYATGWLSISSSRDEDMSRARHDSNLHFVRCGAFIDMSLLGGKSLDVLVHLAKALDEQLLLAICG